MASKPAPPPPKPVNPIVTVGPGSGGSVDGDTLISAVSVTSLPTKYRALVLQGNGLSGTGNTESLPVTKKNPTAQNILQSNSTANQLGVGNILITGRGTATSSTTMIGGASNDFLNASDYQGTLSMLGGSGNTTMKAGIGAATLRGGLGNNTLFASGADQLLIGGGGSNLLVGSSLGGNTLRSGSGSNTLISASASATPTAFAPVSSPAAIGATKIAVSSLTGYKVGQYLQGAGLAPSTSILAITQAGSFKLGKATSKKGATTLAVSSTAGLTVGQYLSGRGIATATTISAINTAKKTITLSTPLPSAIIGGSTLTTLNTLTLSARTIEAIPASTPIYVLPTFATLIGGGASNFLQASSLGGNDSLFASSGNSTLLAGNGRSTLIGGTGVNSLVGSTLSAAIGSSLISGMGSNTLVAGLGVDTLVGTTGPQMAGTSNAFLFNSTSAISKAYLVADNKPTSNGITNSIILGTGLDGATITDPSPSNWTGNFGTLAISTLNGATGIKVQLGTNAEAAGIRTLVGGNGSDTIDLSGYDLTGGAYINALSNVGKNTTSILGGDGNDTIIGSKQGADSIGGGGGNDFFFFNKTNLAANTLDGGPGFDTLAMGLYSQSLDALSFGKIKSLEVLSLSGGSNSVSSLQGSGIMTIVGGTGNDTIRANIATTISTATASGKVLYLTSLEGLMEGQQVSGFGIATGTTISAFDPTLKTITLSDNITRPIAVNTVITAAIDGVFIDGSRGFTQSTAANEFSLRSSANIGATTLQVDTTTLSNPNSLFAGMVLSGSGIARGTTITSILYANGLPSTIGISQAVTKLIAAGAPLTSTFSPTLASGQYLQAMGQGVTVIADTLAGNIESLYTSYNKGNTTAGSATIVAGAYDTNTLVGGAYNTTFLINNQAGVGSQSNSLGSLSAGTYTGVDGRQRYGVNTLQMANPGATLTDNAFSKVSEGVLKVLSVSTGNNQITLGQNAATAGLLTLLGGTGSDTFDASSFTAGNPLFIDDRKALNSSLRGGSGNDIILGGSGTDFISGGGGNDSLVGGVGWNTLIAGAGSSTLDGGAGRTTMQGSSDSTNLYIVRQNSTRIIGSGSNDNVYSFVNFDPIQLATPAVTATGTAASNFITVTNVAGLSIGLQIGNVSNGNGLTQITGITPGTVITAINASTRTLTLSTKLTTSLSNTLLYIAPSGNTLCIAATAGAQGSSNLTLLSTYGLSVGMALNAPGIIPSGTVINKISGTTVTLSNNLLAPATGSLITANYTAPASFSDASPSTTKTQSFASSDLSGFFNLKNFTLESGVATGVGNSQANLITSTGTLSHLLMGLGGNNTLVGYGSNDSLYGYVSPAYGSPNRTAPIAIDSRDQAFFDSVVGAAGNNYIVAYGANSYLDGGPGYSDGLGNATGSNTLVGNMAGDTFVVHSTNDSLVAAAGFNSLVSSANLHNIADNITDALLVVTNQTPSNLQALGPNLPSTPSNSGQLNPSSYLGFGNGKSNSSISQVISFAGFGSITLPSAAEIHVRYDTSAGDPITQGTGGTSWDRVVNPTSLSWTAPTHDDPTRSLGAVQSYNSYFQINYTDANGTQQTSPWLTYLIQTPLQGSNNPPSSINLVNLQNTYTDTTTGKTYQAESYNFQIIPQQNTIPVDSNGNPIAVTLQGSNGNDVVSGEYIELASLQSGQQIGAVGTDAAPYGQRNAFTSYLIAQNGNDLLIAPGLGNRDGNTYTAANGVTFSGINTMVGGVGSDTFFVANGRVDTSTDPDTGLPINSFVADLTIKNAGTTPIDYTNAAPNTGGFSLASGSLDTSGVSLNGGQHNLVISAADAFKLSSTDPSQGQFIDELYVLNNGSAGMGNALDNFIYSSKNGVTLAGDTGRDSIMGGGNSNLLIGGTQFGYDEFGNPIGLDNVGLALVNLYGNGQIGVDSAGNPSYANVNNGVPYVLPTTPYTSFYQDTDPVPMETSGAQAQNPTQFWTLSGPNGPVIDTARNMDTLIAANGTATTAINLVSTYLTQDANNGDTIIYVNSTRGFVVGNVIAGAGIAPKTKITDISNTAITLDTALIGDIIGTTGQSGIVSLGTTPVITNFGSTGLHAATIVGTTPYAKGTKTLSVSWSNNSTGPSKGDSIIGVIGIADGTTIVSVNDALTVGGTTTSSITLSKGTVGTINPASTPSLFSFANSPATTLDGGAGADSMVGGLGNDMFFVSSYAGSLTPTSSGVDKVIGNGGNDTIVWTASDGIWPGYANTLAATSTTIPAPGTYSLDLLSSAGNPSISNIVLGAGSTLAGGATGNAWSTGNDHVLNNSLQGELGSNLIVGNSFDNILSGGGVSGSSKVGNTFINLTGIGFDTLIGGGGNDTFDLTYKNGDSTYNYYVYASTDSVASGIFNQNYGSAVVVSNNIETDYLSISGTNAATDQDYALIDVSGGTTGQQNGSAGILTYSPETGYTVNLAKPSDPSSGYGDPIYLIGSAPSSISSFGMNNMTGGLSGGLTGNTVRDASATSFGIYSYTQGGSQAPNLIAVVNGTTLGNFLDGGINTYKISSVIKNNRNENYVGIDSFSGDITSPLIVDGPNGYDANTFNFKPNHLGGSSQNIKHSNNASQTTTNTSSWYTPSGSYSQTDISTGITTNVNAYTGDFSTMLNAGSPGNNDVHNFIGMGAFYELYDPNNPLAPTTNAYGATNGVTNLSSHVKLV
jgi:hypothetical protein